jgi:hypothetical protein
MCRTTTTKDEPASKWNKVPPPPAAAVARKGPAVYATLGRLRVGFHAICATCALIVTVVAVLLPTWRPVVLLSVLLNSLTARDASTLLPQVPLKTEIVPGRIVAPHREAFKRTMAVMHYANLRILEKLYDNGSTEEWKSTPPTMTTTTLARTYYASCWALGWYWFAPTRSDVRNGNTWIFVVPMFAAVITDVPAQLVGKHRGGTAAMMQLEHYLLIELSALIIAFGFTLAFRGYVSVPRIYFGSALCVAGLFVMVMMRSAIPIVDTTAGG